MTSVNLNECLESKLAKQGIVDIYDCIITHTTGVTVRFHSVRLAGLTFFFNIAGNYCAYMVTEHREQIVGIYNECSMNFLKTLL
ncbi:hypothetical protein ACTXT7_008372 [Hymenolepis weldensis]